MSVLYKNDDSSMENDDFLFKNDEFCRPAWLLTLGHGIYKAHEQAEDTARLSDQREVSDEQDAGNQGAASAPGGGNRAVQPATTAP